MLELSHKRLDVWRRSVDLVGSDVDQLGRFDRHAVARRRSRRSWWPCWSRGTIRARGAIVAFAASKEESEEDERCNSARAINETCHLGYPTELLRAAVPAGVLFHDRYYRFLPPFLDRNAPPDPS